MKLKRIVILLSVVAAVLLTAALLTEYPAASIAVPTQNGVSRMPVPLIDKNPPKSVLKPSSVASTTENDAHRPPEPLAAKKSQKRLMKSASARSMVKGRQNGIPTFPIDKQPSPIVKAVDDHLVLETGGWPVQTLLLPQGTKPLANQAPFPVAGQALTRPAPPAENSPILPRRQPR